MNYFIIKENLPRNAKYYAKVKKFKKLLKGYEFFEFNGPFSEVLKLLKKNCIFLDTCWISYDEEVHAILYTNKLEVIFT